MLPLLQVLSYRTDFSFFLASVCLAAISGHFRGGCPLEAFLPFLCQVSRLRDWRPWLLSSKGTASPHPRLPPP